MQNNYRKWIMLALALGTAWLAVYGLLWTFSSAQAWSEEESNLYFDPLDYRPLDQREYVSPTVSSIHFDLVGALAIAAGFSVTDAATIQAWSEAPDKGNLPEQTPVYTFSANPANYPVAPPITSVITSTICPSPSTTGPTVSMGSTDSMTECMECFTERLGPYGVFFHMPHDNSEELGAIKAWAFGQTDTLRGRVVFGYSSTTQFEWQDPAVNIYKSTPCFVTQTVSSVDTGNIQAGDLPAFGIYLHSLGDNWSHKECIAAADGQGKPFAAHVKPDGPSDPLWPCRWTHHAVEFGDPLVFTDSNRTFSGTLALYEAITAFADQSTLPIYRSIPLTAEENHIYETLYTFVHTATVLHPEVRRQTADDLRNWALQTRASNPDYWLHDVFLPVVLKSWE